LNVGEEGGGRGTRISFGCRRSRLREKRIATNEVGWVVCTLIHRESARRLDDRSLKGTSNERDLISDLLEIRASAPKGKEQKQAPTSISRMSQIFS
jgi:hypothetical protein